MLGLQRTLRLSKLLFCFTLAAPLSASATVVTMHTSFGDIGVQLYDSTAPKTVANFLNYVNSGAYTDSFFHRSLPGFVVQGGGFTWNDITHISDITTNAPVVNEFGASNTYGTIAMAKSPSGPDTATSQWFFNLADNAANLDNQNGGFTVFGQVIGQGMDVVNAIAAVKTYYASSTFDHLPLISLPAANQSFTSQNFVMVSGIDIAVPAPSAVWSFAVGILAIAGCTRRKIKAGL
jgi:peptidyl-prolyl cis-trans isomerase A (cyclophilin A)